MNQFSVEMKKGFKSWSGQLLLFHNPHYVVSHNTTHSVSHCICVIDQIVEWPLTWARFWPIRGHMKVCMIRLQHHQLDHPRAVSAMCCAFMMGCSPGMQPILDGREWGWVIQKKRKNPCVHTICSIWCSLWSLYSRKWDELQERWL